ncbi:hypothetical protein L9W92_15625 [Pelotomaculum terephthalicicum JT]|uniref:heme-binding Shp domain-containing protein n=1 Tax=Pelotomaculum TaxID=191373 RepID=UPI0009C48386|nr:MULTISPECIES: heme-binding Shp domain-containing protein [Pelotomaculum]MCG9969441.1 hypothetical protein [Pelotomaculum terephthalicicum JT]OPX91509.1 MAG: Cell surface heme-binding protein Shp [Pelotomaculum sp. PtaB.Bin117]OPY63752.1 MAG: Cell surface heme-binding protein Shp [Pelotomaculum sp. PtaU1.Bin065]
MIKKLLLGLLVLGAAVAGAAHVPAFALTDGTYVVSNNTHYVNPDTGTADDGGDTSTGEAMCRNTVYPVSLYEQKNGKHYVTLRLKMISFIKDIKFNVQSAKGDGASYREVSYEVVGGNKEENTEDFRFALPAADVLINPSFFVGPMNRDVTFFVAIDMSSAKKDDGKFAAFNGTAVNSNSGSQPAPEQSAAPAGPSADQAKPDDSLPPEADPAAVGSPDGSKAQADISSSAARADGTKEVQGIVEFGVQGEAAPAENRESASASPVLPIVFATVVCLGAGGYFIYRGRTKNKLNQV